MSKKMLEESQIRRMMKFANIDTLAESFFDRIEEEDPDKDAMASEMGYMAEEEDEDDMEAEMPADDMEAEMPADDMEAEMPADDMEAEMPADDMAAASPELEGEIKGLMQTIAAAVKDEYNVDITIDGEEPMGSEMPADDMGAEMPADDMAPEMSGGDLGAPMGDEEVEDEDPMMEANNMAEPSNPGKGMTTQGSNKTQATPYKSFSEKPGEDGPHDLSNAPESKSKNNSRNGTDTMKADKQPPMATNEMLALKEAVTSIVKKILKERKK